MAIAIIGSGPAGCYTADLLSRALPEVQIDVYERLQEPFGLVRYGVAPDHAGTKAVTQLFSRTLKRPNLRFFNNTHVGRDSGISALEEQYRVVVVATGAGAGRVPDFPGAQSLPMLTGLQLAALFNGHDLDRIPMLPTRASGVVIFGNGNVSLDAARLLTKPGAQLLAAGVAAAVIDWRDALGIEQIHIIGRGNPAQTRFGLNELRELGTLEGFRPVVRADDVVDPTGPNEAALPILAGFAEQGSDTRRAINFHFACKLECFQAGSLSLACGDGSQRILEAGLGVPAIGQLAARVDGLPYDESTGCIPNQDGLVTGRTHTYVVGWAASPAGGSIPASRKAAAALLPRLLTHFEDGAASSVVQKTQS